VIRCRNCVGCSELAFAAELCVLQRIYDSLPKLCRLQRINNSLPSGMFCSELANRCQSGVVCSESLPKLSWLQRIVIRCRNWAVCYELHLLPKLWRQQRKSFRCRIGCVQRSSFPCRIGCVQRSSSRCRIGCVQRNNSRCWIGQPAANEFSLPISTISLLGRNDLNASNNFMVWWCKIWNTWMWTYELLK